MKQYDEITPKLRDWIAAQRMFFVATAPIAADGHVNLSPRGMPETFGVIDEHTFAWLDLTGSGSETIAHLRENGRIVVMFCGFAGPPQIVRLHGTGRVVLPEDPDWSTYDRFPDRPGRRAIIVVDVTRVSDSCGYAVPKLAHVEDRDLLDRWAHKKGEPKLAAYRAEKNARSIDGLPALDPTEPTEPVMPEQRAVGERPAAAAGDHS